MQRRRFVPRLDLSPADYAGNALVWAFWAVVFGLTALKGHNGGAPPLWLRHLCAGGSLFLAVRFGCLAAGARRP